MAQRQCVLRRWLIGYIAALFVTLPIALPCWNAWLVNSIGRFMTIEAIHVAQYAGLGWVASAYARACQRPRRKLDVLLALGMGVGLLEEAGQAWMPQRVFQWSDVALDWSGILVGVALSGTLEKLSRRRVNGTVEGRPGSAHDDV